MSDFFECPECDHIHTIGEIELWEVYDEDGKVTDYKCDGCGVELTIHSAAIEWEFSVEACD